MKPSADFSRRLEPMMIDGSVKHPPARVCPPQAKASFRDAGREIVGMEETMIRLSGYGSSSIVMGR